MFLHIAKHVFSLVLKLFLLGHGNSRMKWTKAVKGSVLDPACNIRSGLFSHKIGSGYGPKVAFASDVCERVEVCAFSSLSLPGKVSDGQWSQNKSPRIPQKYLTEENKTKTNSLILGT